MTLVRRFTMPHAVSAGEDVFVAGVGYFVKGVLDIPTSSTSAITAATAFVANGRGADLGTVDNAVTPAPTQVNGNPFPQYLTVSDAANSVSQGTDQFGVALRAALGTPCGCR